MSLFDLTTRIRTGRFGARTAPLVLLIGLLVVVPSVAQFLDDPFLIKVFTRVIVFGIAAVGLNLILGFGDLISLMQAGFFGIGGYTVAILAYHDMNVEP